MESGSVRLVSPFLSSSCKPFLALGSTDIFREMGTTFIFAYPSPTPFRSALRSPRDSGTVSAAGLTVFFSHCY